MALIVRKLKDSVSTSDGKDKAPVGVSTFDRGGGGGKNKGIQATVIPPPKQPSNQKKKRQEAIIEQQKKKEQYEASIKSARARPKTTTGKYERGGEIIQETRGDYNTLKNLKEQRPNSAIVQDRSGDYVLIETRSGANLNRPGELDRLNEKANTLFTPTVQDKPEGGKLYTPKIKDSVTVSSEQGGFIESPGGTDYSVVFGADEKPETRPAQPREIAEMISAGEIAPQFIGAPSLKVSRQMELAASQQKIRKGVEPTTYVDSRGQEIVTITGQSKSGQFTIMAKPEIVKEKGVGQASVLNLLKAKQTPKMESPSKSIERVLKRGAEPFYAAGVETFAPLVTKTLRLMGQDSKAEKITGDLNVSYEKVASPPEGLTPVQNLMSTGEIQTGRGLVSDIIGYGTEILLLGGGAIGEIGNLRKVKDIPLLLSKLKTPQKPPTPPPRTYQTNLQGSQFIVQNKVFKVGQKLDMRITQMKLGRSEGFVYKKPMEINLKNTPTKPKIDLIGAEFDLPGGGKITKIPLGRTLPDDIIKIEGKPELVSGRSINPFEGVKKSQPNPKTDIRDVQYRSGSFVVTPKRLGLAREIYRQEGLISFKRPNPFEYERVVKPQPTAKPFDDLIIPASKPGGFSKVPINLGRTLPDDIIKIEGTKILSGKKYVNPFEGVKKSQPEGVQLSKEKITADDLERFLKKSGSKLDWEFKSSQFKGSPGKYRMDKSKNFGQQLKIKEKTILLKKEKIKLTQDKSIIDQWQITRIGLGTSENVLLVRDGKTQRDTINKQILKSPSKTPTSFLIRQNKKQISTTPIISNRIYTPPLLKQTQSQRVKLSGKIIPINKPKINQKQKTRSVSLLRTAAIPSPTTPSPQKTQGVFPDQPQKPIQDVTEKPKPKPPRLALVWGKRPEDKERKPKAKRKYKTDFIGSTNLETVEGFRTRKSDITYGDTKTAKLARRNIQKTRGSRREIRFF